MGVPPEFLENGAPEYPPLPDEYNRFPTAKPPEVAESRSKRLRKMMLLLAAAGLAILGVFTPMAVKTAEAEPTYPVTAYLDTPSAGSGYLTVEGSDQSGERVSAPKGATVRLHLVPNAPYTEADVSPSDVLLEGEVYATDDPFLFTVGEGGGVIHFSMAYPPRELYSVQAWHEPPSGAKAYLILERTGERADGYTGILAPEGARVRLEYEPIEPYDPADVSLGGVMLDGAIEKTEDPLVFTVGEGGGVIHFFLNYPQEETPTPTPSPSPSPVPTPEVQELRFDPIFFRCSWIHYGWVELEHQDAVTAVHLEVWERGLNLILWSHDMTDAEIMAGYCQLPVFDGNQLYADHPDMNNEPLLELRTVLTLEGENGPEQRESTVRPSDEQGWGIRYWPANFEPLWEDQEYYPDSFAVRSYESYEDYPRIRMGGMKDAMETGEICVELYVNGHKVPEETGYVVNYLDSSWYYYDDDGEQVPLNLYYTSLVIPRPADEPPTGTAQIIIYQQLNGYDKIWVMSASYAYDTSN